MITKLPIEPTRITKLTTKLTKSKIKWGTSHKDLAAERCQSPFYREGYSLLVQGSTVYRVARSSKRAIAVIMRDSFRWICNASANDAQLRDRLAHLLGESAISMSFLPQPIEETKACAYRTKYVRGQSDPRDIKGKRKAYGRMQRECEQAQKARACDRANAIKLY